MGPRVDNGKKRGRLGKLNEVTTRKLDAREPILCYDGLEFGEEGPLLPRVYHLSAIETKH